MKSFSRIAIFTTVAILTACGGSSQTTTPDAVTAEHHGDAPDSTAESAPTGMHHAMKEMCPMAVEGTTMAMEEVDGAMTMVFTNQTNAAEVQRRAKLMVERHQKMDMTAMAEGHHQGAHDHGSKMAEHKMMPMFTVSAEDTDTGARLTMTPKDPAQLDAMRAMMKKRHADGADKPCPMMVMGEATES